MNLRLPPTPIAVEVKVAVIDLGEAVKAPEEGVVVEEHG